MALGLLELAELAAAALQRILGQPAHDGQLGACLRVPSGDAARRADVRHLNDVSNSQHSRRSGLQIFCERRSFCAASSRSPSAARDVRRGGRDTSGGCSDEILHVHPQQSEATAHAHAL
eukprot:scaffold8346_cov119-Isochrysis_galbana.AAC.11